MTEKGLFHKIFSLIFYQMSKGNVKPILGRLTIAGGSAESKAGIAGKAKIYGMCSGFNNLILNPFNGKA